MSDLTLRDKLLKSSGLVSESLLNKIDTDIAPNDPSNISLGSEDKKFKAIYADEVHISQNTLYIGDTPILGTNEDTINIKADKDQSILIKTQGTGSSQMTSETGILLKTTGTAANINITADGTNSDVSINAKTKVSLNAPSIVLDGSTSINDLTVTGAIATVGSTNLSIKDNLIEINSGETGKGVTAGTAGIKVNRGDELPYLIQFDEADDRFKVGKQGNLETIATQDYVDEAVSNVTFEHPETHPASMITGLADVATSGSYNDLSNKPTIPTSLPADGGNADTVNGHTVLSDVPADAKFTDTVYAHPTSGVTAGTYRSVTVNAQGHITAGSNPTVTIAQGGTGATTAAGALTNLGLTATATELNYVDGVTSNIQTQLNTKAPLTSPALTGTPTAPTAAAGTNTTQVATTAFVTTAIANKTTVSGNAGSATKLATARTIDGVSFNGSANIVHYSTCSTAAATAAKTVALTGFTLATGASVKVKFTVTNTAANPTLNVNSTGAKAIMYRGSAISAGYLAANRVYEFVYDGTDWELVGDINTNTTYSTGTASTAGITKLYTSTGTATDGTMTQSAINTALGTKLNASGGTLSGNLNIKGSLQLTSTYNDGTGTTYTSDVIKAITSNKNYGHNVAFGGNGNTIVGAGESWTAQLDALAGNSDENTYICADGAVIVKPNCNTFSSGKEFQFTTDGKIMFPDGSTLWIA